MYQYNLGLKFAQIASQYAEKDALIFSATEIYSFREIDLLSNQIARYLLMKGVNQDEVVCILGEKTVYVYCTILACIKTGIIYSVFDPDSPPERFRRIVRKCSPKFIFSNDEFKSKFYAAEEVIEWCCINYDEQFYEDLNHIDSSEIHQANNVHGNSIAYIMFTSGSTGFPKGACMTHLNILNFINWAGQTYKILPEDVFTNLNPLFFDNSVFDFYASIFSGSSLVPFSKAQVSDPEVLMRRVDEFKCNSWFSVPSLLIFLQTMKAFETHSFHSLKRIIFGGEGYPKAKLKPLFELYSSRISFFNVYGPTECTCICSSYYVLDADFEDISGFLPLGNLIENFAYHILDDQNVKVNEGEVGELCLLGPQVGKGYYNEENLTEIAFIQNPYNYKYKDVIYKTGDLVFYNVLDDKIYICGRKDNQIKHMGYRIELEEIENALSCVKGVSQNVVIQIQKNGFSKLHAIIAGDINFDENQIKRELANLIPLYMIPAQYTFMMELPKNTNGKIDRKKIQQLINPG